MQISSVSARQILDSRGDPTVEAEVHLEDGSMGRGSVPSGASTGTHEALELRDGEQEHFGGKGVLAAVAHVNTKIDKALKDKKFESIYDIDKLLLELDGTENKKNLGANAILAVSMAATRAAAAARELELFEYIAELWSINAPALKLGRGSMPRPMFNILNGGAHAGWSTDIQEFMVIPLHASSFSQSLEIGAEIFHSLEALLKTHKLSTLVGNEGGFAPHLAHNQEAFELAVEAIENAGYTPGVDVGIGVDFAASEFFAAHGPGTQDDRYQLKLDGRDLTRDLWMAQIEQWLKKYPIISIEDPLAEDDWANWQAMVQDQTQKLEQIVGDDLLVTNPKRIQKAIELKACNALLVKLNQVGTVTETLTAMQMAHQAGWANIVSHRSGETEDTFIAHLAVGTAAGQIKSGAPSRGERVAKYNELLRIEEKLLQK